MKMLKKIGAMFLVLALLVPCFATYASALSSSKSFRTGYKKGYVIQTQKSYTGTGRRRWAYTSAKDVYVSERVIVGKFVRYDGPWHATEDVDKLSVSSSKSIGVSGSVSIAKRLNLSTSVSTGTSVGASYRVNPRKGEYCRLALKCDYVEITYVHYTYNSSGRQKSKTTKTVLVPIPDTATYYVVYDD